VHCDSLLRRSFQVEVNLRVPRSPSGLSIGDCW
jgi:hypothetical protein